MVEMTGFEPAASASRTQRSTKLSHISLFIFLSTLTKDNRLRRAATQLPFAVPEIYFRLLPINFDRGTRFCLAVSRTASARQRAHQTEPHLATNLARKHLLLYYDKIRLSTVIFELSQEKKEYFSNLFIHYS